MKKYTHRIKIEKEEIDELSLENYGETDTFITNKYWKDGYLYGYLADGILLGNVAELDIEYVIFEYWWRVRGREVERI